MQDQQQTQFENPKEENPQEQHDSAPRKWIRQVFIITMLVGTGLVLFLYGMYFNDFSETELVNLSFVWIACLAFGFSGLELEKKRKKYVLLKAFGFAFLALFVLVLFFATMWSAL